jgi:hypothetical protein
MSNETETDASGVVDRTPAVVVVVVTVAVNVTGLPGESEGADGPSVIVVEVVGGGGGELKVNWSDALLALVPPRVVTSTSTRPCCAEGETAVIVVGEI